jgi:hypothetical protein
MGTKLDKTFRLEYIHNDWHIVLSIICPAIGLTYSVTGRHETLSVIITIPIIIIYKLTYGMKWCHFGHAKWMLQYFLESRNWSNEDLVMRGTRYSRDWPIQVCAATSEPSKTKHLNTNTGKTGKSPLGTSQQKFPFQRLLERTYLSGRCGIVKADIVMVSIFLNSWLVHPVALDRKKKIKTPLYATISAWPLFRHVLSLLHVSAHMGHHQVSRV